MARPLTPSPPHARQASRILALCGAESELIADCGVAGLHRLLGQLDRCAKCAGGMAWQRPAALTDVHKTQGAQRGRGGVRGGDGLRAAVGGGGAGGGTGGGGADERRVWCEVRI